MSFKFEQPVHCDIIQYSYSTYVLSKNLALGFSYKPRMFKSSKI